MSADDRGSLSAVLLRILAVGLPLAATVATADTLVTRTQTYDGTFMRYEKNMFHFNRADGTAVVEPRMTVEALTLTPPREGVLEQGSRTLDVKLLGYKQAKFSIIKDGPGAQEETVYGMQVQRLVAREEPSAAAAGGLPEPPKPQPMLDVTHLSARLDLTPAQMAAVKLYLAQRAPYDAFVRESTKMVAAMDQAKGKGRGEMLDALRARKVQETALRQALTRAENGLRAAFPRGIPAAGAGANGVEAPDTPPRPADPAAVVLLDTAPLAAHAGLTAAQTNAIKAYQEAVRDYMKASGTGTGARDARDAIKRAEATLLAAFPDVVIE